MKPITPCLWFDADGEEAAEFYTSTFPDSRITHVARYGSAGPGPEGQAMTVEFELNGQPFLALNGGPVNAGTFTEGLSFQVFCDSQEEVDRYWDAITAEGEEGPCAWCKDKWGVSWQIVPIRLTELLTDPDPGRAQRAMTAMLGMKKIVIADLEAAAAAE
jgi:predicted 3-demethylubiquinone-9 3-methyltransferase (glyoxalase superfamily)